jgi:hypothetical protein
VDFYAGTREPSDRMVGALSLEGKLFSDLSRVAICIRADDEQKRTLFLNVVAYRAVH